jgi:uncharacterized membrane protein
MPSDFSASNDDLGTWGALALAAVMVTSGTRKRSLAGLGLVLAATPLLYRGVSGQWPRFLHELASREDDTRAALGGDRGVHVRESIRLEKPVEDVYRWWRALEHLPQALSYLESVTESGNGRSHWIAKGPAGTHVEWDAEIIDDTQNERLSWRSLPGSEVVSAGSVLFETVRGGRSTQLTVHLQYEPPAGHIGAFVAAAFGRAPSQTIREDLRRVKQLLEAGESPRAQAMDLDRRNDESRLLSRQR